MMKRQLILLALGVIAGAVIMLIAMVSLMPSAMLVTHKSPLRFEETVTALEAAIPKAGWSSPGTMRLDQAMAKKGVEFKARVALVSLCKAEYAKRVLTTDRYLSALMPCRIAVWEGDDGQVYLSKMNTGIMGKLFGGTVARVMGGSVARDEEAILSAVLK